MMNGLFALSDVNSRDACEEWVHQRRSPQLSAEHWERTAPRRRRDYDV